MIPVMTARYGYRRSVPSVSSIVLLVAVLTLVAAFVVGVTTQTTTSSATTSTTTTEAPAGQLEGLVLDGGGVTTTAPLSSAGRPVDPIPHRSVPGVE